MKHVNTLLLEGAIKLERESGRGHVRDIDSEIFARPVRHSYNVDFEGDTPHYMGMERQARLTNRQKLRRAFQNASLTKKNAIRKVMKQAKEASKRLGLVMK